MKANCALELSDTDRGRIRAALDRGGLATRKEIRIFVDRAVRDAIAGSPEPKTRRRPAQPSTATASTRRQLEDLQALPDETVCDSCRRPKSEHGRMGLSCLPRPGQMRGGRFTPAGGR